MQSCLVEGLLFRKVATNLRGSASSNSSLLHRSFVNLALKKKYENRSTFAEVI